MKIQTPRRILCLSIGLILICSCGGGKRTVLTNATSQIRQDLTSGDFQKALDKCQVGYQKNPKDAGILEQYLEAIEHIKVLADKAFEREDFVLAGSTYALLLKNFPQFAPFANKLSFDANYLTLKIRVSRTRVVERQGPLYLKAGSLQKAIDLYRELHQQYPRDLVVQNSYTSFLQLIKANADLAFEKNDFVLAGSTYTLLLKNFPQFAPFANKLSFDANYLTLKIRVSRTRVVERQGPLYLKAGSLQKAIDLYRELHQQYPRDLVVQNSYTSFLQLIKANADLAFEKNDLVPAGNTYRILLRNFGAFNFVGRFFPYDRELLNTNIKECQRKLFENGLEQYRSGNLSLAISIWKSVLTFDPENPEVKKAVNMAILQSRNLERNEVSDVK